MSLALPKKAIAPYCSHHAEDVQKTVVLIKAATKILSQQTDLSPDNALVTQYLTAVVKALEISMEQGYADDVINNPCLAYEQTVLPSLSGAAECEMEKYWARDFIKQSQDEKRALQKGDLQRFWYQAEYEALCEAEWNLIDKYRDEIDSLCFLGSGALPLTGILAAMKDPSLSVTCVDADPWACELSRELIAALGLSDQITVKQQFASDYKPNEKEVVICASLLVNKDGVYDAMVANGVQHLIVRDCEGVYKFLYEEASTPPEDYQFIEKTPPSSEHINTSLYYRLKPRVI